MQRLLLFFLIISCQSLLAQRTLLIHSVQLIDGSGTLSKKGAVRIKDSLIIAVGQLDPLPSDSLYDGQGLALVPGFIDTHSHHYGELDTQPFSIATNSQGITTIVIGQDGESESIDSIRSFLLHHPVAVNIASYTGHSTLREKVMGPKNLNRAATSSEISAMQKLLAIEMQRGSLGLSSGLEYESAFYSSTHEVIALAKTAALFQGRYTSHIRSEDVTLDAAITELLQIGKVTGMPIQFSHLKIGLRDRWGQAAAVLDRLDSARRAGIQITADVYPYDFWSSTLKVLFPKRDYTNLSSAIFATEHLFDPAQSVLVRYAPAPAWVGQTITSIATQQAATPATTLLSLVQQANAFRQANPQYTSGIEAVAAKAMAMQDVNQFIGWEHANLCSDGRAGGHPRGYGAFTKMIRVYVREQKLLSLEKAIQKMTSLGAAHAGIKKRGLIAPGYYADLVLLNPMTVADQATLENSTALSTGIQSVWINGRQTYLNQSGSTQARPGVFIAR
jgi:N-acyl-D-amino-acid deacylase